jgi:hypothetical protein
MGRLSKKISGGPKQTYSISGQPIENIRLNSGRKTIRVANNDLFNINPSSSKLTMTPSS